MHKDVLVAVNYFSGWWRIFPNKYETDYGDWRSRYPERISLLGCFNDQETMDAEIIAASDHGVDVFVFLWYPERPERHPHGSKLNDGLRQFIKSPEAHRMKFMIEFCNHTPFSLSDSALWEESCREWAAYMAHPSYLRLGSKPVFKIHGLQYFYDQNDRDADEIKRKLDLFHRISLQNGLDQLIIGAGSMPLDMPDELPITHLFQYLSTYMDVPNKPVQEQNYTYEELLKLSQTARRQYGDVSPIPYIPYLPAGWDPKPWEDPRPSFDFPNTIQWEKALSDMKVDLLSNTRFRLPDGTADGQPMFTIYAWNEFAEGGIVAPTVGEGWSKLKGIKNVFLK